MKKLRQISAALLIFSCFSHFGEAVVLAPKHAMGSMLFGLIYFVIGLMLFMKHPYSYWAALIFTSIGLLAAIVLVFQGSINFFLVLHIAIDIFVIYVCAKHFRKRKAV